MNRKIKWGIIGLGKIAQKFVNDLILVETAELEAVASRDLAKAEAFAETNHSKKFYGTYEALLQDKLVDIVYIANVRFKQMESQQSFNSIIDFVGI